MGTIFKIAVRNIWRHKRRTFLTGIIIAVGFAVYLMMDSMISGADRSSIENMINLTESAVKIYSVQYDNEKKALPLKYGISNYAEVEKHLLGVPEIKGVTPRTRFLGEINTGDKSVHVIGTVIDPVKDPSVFRLSNYIKVGRYFSTNSQTEIIIGKNLARSLGLKMGDSLTLQAKTRYGAFNAVDFEIVGLVESSSPELNDNGACITYAGAGSFLDLGGLVTEVNTSIPWPRGQDATIYTRTVERVRDGIKAGIKDVSAYTFKDNTGAFLALLKQKGAAGSIMSFLILLIAAVGIVNSVLMSVYERIREVGVLKAMGFQSKDIYWMFLYEGMLIGFVGSVLGMAMGVLINIWLVYYGMDLVAMLGDNFSAAGFPVWGNLYGQWNAGSFIGCFVAGIVISAVASIVPARKAARMQATDCLKFV